MATIDDSLIINPDLTISAGSLASVWDAEIEAHNSLAPLKETLSGLDDYCDDPPSNPEKLSSWIDHEHETSPFLWNISFTYTGLAPNSSRYYSIQIYDPNGFVPSDIDEVYGVFPTAITLKLKPATGYWTFELIERDSFSTSVKASTTQLIAAIISSTSLNTTVNFSSSN